MSDTFLARSRAIAARMLGGEMMIMSAKDSTFFTLNEVATLIWQAADGRTPITQIADAICQEFDVDRDTAMRDAEQFAVELAQHGILLRSDHPFETPPVEAA